LPPGGGGVFVETFHMFLEHRMVPLVRQFMANARQSGVDLQFTDAYRSAADQEARRNSASAHGAASGTSLHQLGMAVDVNFRQPQALPGSNLGTVELQNLIVDAALRAGLNWGAEVINWDEQHHFENRFGLPHDQQFLSEIAAQLEVQWVYQSTPQSP